MSTPATPIVPPLRVRPSSDGRIATYLFIAVAALLAGLLLSQPVFVALAAVFAPVLVAGLIRTHTLDVAATVRWVPEQVVEGAVARLELELDIPEWASAQVLFSLPDGLRLADRVGGAPGDRAVALAAPGPRPAVASWEIQAVGWGRHTLGDLQLELASPTGIITWQASLSGTAELRVLPTPARVDELLAPAATRITYGSHLARRQISHGSDFAEIRAYQPGDRLRDLNRAATARRASPHVNRRHPELAGDVVLLIDAYPESTGGVVGARERALQECTRAAWAVARVHLAAQDRVGLLAQGDRPVWLEPTSGNRARYQLLDTLLSVTGGSTADGWTWQRDPTDLIPASALVVAISPLWSEQLVYGLARLKARGRTVVALALDANDVLGSPADADAAVLHRLFAISVRSRQRQVQASGVPVIEFSRGSVEAALAAAARAARAAAGVGVRR